MITDTNVEAVHWREWDQAAFWASRQERKPVLLTLTATWCHWCHVMDETSYSDQRVIALINSRFIPVRVDVDQRPDISRRYNQGGFPSVAVLDSEGGLLAGRVYTPPEEMLQLLEEVLTKHTGLVAVFGNSHDAAMPVAQPPSPEFKGDESPDGDVLLRLEELYDHEFGGFGMEPKQPPWEGIRFLLELYSRTGGKAYLKMAVNSLDGMIAGLYDLKNQGFFRYSVSRDWRVPHYEKMLISNANLAILYLEAYQITRKKNYREVATGTLEYLSGTLYDQSTGLFYSSQDAWEDYYRLPWNDRETAEQPTVDHNPYVGWNAVAASAFIKAYAVLGESTYLRTAVRNLEVIWEHSWHHEMGFRHLVGMPGQQPSILEDHVMFVRASLDLFQSTYDAKHLKMAVEVTQTIQAKFRAFDGGYYDISEIGPALAGAPLAREKPVLENSLLAEALIALGCITGEDQYQIWAREALIEFEKVVPGSSYRGSRTSRRVEEDEERLFLPAASAWARARQCLAHGPIHLVIVGPSSHPATEKILRATLRKYVPHRVVQVLDPERDGERISASGFTVSDEPVLYQCMNNMCLAPIRSIQDVSRSLSSKPWTHIQNSPLASSK